MASRTDERKALLQRLATYVPFHAVTEAVRGGRLRPGKERREGTVVVADLSGFTSLSESFARRGRDGTDELTQILNRIFSALLERAVFPYHGYLVKFAGDALLSFYPGERHDAWACTSAVQMQREMERITSLLKRNLALRIGVASGEFDLVTVDSRSGRLDCFCSGDAALRALAAADHAGPGEIILDAEGLPRGPFRSGSQLLELACGADPVTPDPIPDPLTPLEPPQVEHLIEQVRGFLAPELFDRIVGNPSAATIPAERRHACAVFCELDGWRGDVELLCEHYDAACESATRHGGSVNKMDATSAGPRLLATFGIPSAHGDDERRAVAFALELRARLRTPVRIGLESGSLFAGEVGSVRKREVTVMGDTVNVAARLAHAAKPGQVLCGPECWSRADAFVGRPTAPFSLKGKSIPVTPVEVVAPRRFTASRLQRRIGHPGLIGRERELAQLEERAGRALAGEAIGLEVLGPAGIGKSALVGVAVDRWLDAGGISFSARCEYDKRDQPFLLFKAIVAAWLDVPMGSSAEEVRAALERNAIGGELAQATARFLAPDGASQERNAEPGAARLLAARLIREVSRSAPLLVVVENTAHADSASADLFAYALQTNRDSRLFILTTNRTSAESEAQARKRGFSVLHLRPLDRPAVRILLARVLEVQAVSDLLEESVEARARGNPLFVLRLARWLMAKGFVERLGGRATLSLRAAEDIAHALPPDLESLVNAEIDQLPQLVREVLRMVSVLGHEFTPELAATVCEGGDIDKQQASEALQHLSHAGLLVTTGGARPTYRFARLTDREVIYSGLPADRRRALHARVAQVLSERNAAMDRLASHYDAADDHPNAARCCQEVARQAQRRGAYADALRLYRAASRHLEALEQDRTECEIGEVECLARLASYGEARELALALADRLPDPATRIRALVSAALCASYGGDLEAAGAILRRAKAEIPSKAPAPLRTGVLFMCASIHNSMGQPLEALEELSEAGQLSGEDMAPIVLGLTAGLLAETERVEEALPKAKEALALAERHQNRGNLAFSLISLGRALELSGETSEARERYLAARAIYNELGQPANAANAQLHAAQVDLSLGDAKGALAQLEPALEIFRHYQSGQDETAALCSIGRARFVLGEREQAVRDLEEAVRRSETTLEHHAAIAGRAYLAEALWQSDRARAEGLLDAALRIGDERQMAAELREARAVAARLR
ncbi:MAG: AAA family ATPase [Myxococcales bacterium]